MKKLTSKLTKLFQAKKFPDMTDRVVFTWQEPCWKGGTVSYEDRILTWNSGVQKAIRPSEKYTRYTVVSSWSL